MIQVFLKRGMLGEEVAKVELPADEGITPRLIRDRFVDSMVQGIPIDVAVDGRMLGDEQLDEPLGDWQQIILLPKTTADVLAFLAYAVVYALVAYGVNYLIGVLWPASKPDGVTQDRGDESSPTYSWDGIKTNYGPGLPIPWLYGRHAVGGQVIWTEITFGAPGFGAFDRLRIVLSLCEGPTHRIGERAGSIDAMGRLPGTFGGAQLPVGITINGSVLPSPPVTPPANTGARAWVRPGTHDQTPLPDPFVGVRQVFTPLSELAQLDDSFVFTFTDTAQVSGLTIVFVMPNGSYQQNASGTLIGFATRVEIAWRPQGSTSWVILHAAYEISSALFPIQSFIATTFVSAIPAGTAGPIEVRVTRITPSAGTTGVAQLIWRDITIVSPHTLRYPLESLLALEIDAGPRFVGGLPQITVPVEGALVRVWDATNGWSPRCWNVPAAPFNFNTHPPGRNNAWIALDYLLARWGLGNFLTEANIDLPAFRRWAAFCDSDPDPATPWGEPSFCVDIVGDVPKAAWDWFLTICNAGRASPTVRNGKLSVVYHYRDSHGDAGITVPAKTPTQLLSSGNVEDVQVKWISQASRPTIYQFQFSDETKNWAQDVFPVEDDEGSLNDPSVLHQDKYLPEGVQAFGVTRTSQLFREGKWRHRITRLVRRELSFVTGPWALAAEVGDLIDFQSEMLRPFSTDVPVAMQVTAVADTTHLTIDHALTGSGLQFVGRDPDGKPTRANITSYVNTGSTAALTLAAAVTVNVGAACVVGKVNKLTETYVIVAISLQQDLKRKVQCLQWTPGAYDPITKAAFEEGGGGNSVIDAPPVFEDEPAVLGILVVGQSSGVHRISWGRPPGAVGARVYLREDISESPWQLLGTTELSELLTPPLETGRRYVVSVCLENHRGAVAAADLGDQQTFTAGPSVGALLPQVSHVYLFGEATGDSPDIEMGSDGGALVEGMPAMPVADPMVATTFAITFMSDTLPAGPWTAVLERRVSGGYFVPVGTAEVRTSP